MNIYPVIKPSTWKGFQQTEEQFLQNSLLDDPLIDRALPQVVYAMDQKDSLAYITENFFKGQTDDDVRAKAYADLRKELAEENWQALDFNEKCDGLQVLAMQTPFHGSEVILLEERMAEACSLLKVSRVLVCTPYRGLAFVLPFDDQKQSALEIFLGVCYENYHSPKNEPVSDTVWVVQRGTIKGILDVNKDFKGYHLEKNQAAAIDDQPTQHCSAGNEVEKVSELSVAPPHIKFFSSVQIGLGAFLGTPLVGILLIAANLRNIQQIAKANIVTVVALFAMPLLILLYANIPPQPYEKLFPAVSALITLLIGKCILPTTTLTVRRSYWVWLLYLLSGLAMVFGILLLMFKWI